MERRWVEEDWIGKYLYIWSEALNTAKASSVVGIEIFSLI